MEEVGTQIILNGKKFMGEIAPFVIVLAVVAICLIILDKITGWTKRADLATEENWEKKAKNKIFLAKLLYQFLFIILIFLTTVSFDKIGVIPHPSLLIWFFYLLITLILSKFLLIGRANFAGWWKSTLFTSWRATSISMFLISLTVLMVFANEIKLIPDDLTFTNTINILLSVLYASALYRLASFIYKLETQYRERKYEHLADVEPKVRTRY